MPVNPAYRDRFHAAAQSCRVAPWRYVRPRCSRERGDQYGRMGHQYPLMGTVALRMSPVSLSAAMLIRGCRNGGILQASQARHYHKRLSVKFDAKVPRSAHNLANNSGQAGRATRSPLCHVISWYVHARRIHPPWSERLAARRLFAGYARAGFAG
jgi:hypothetical protein